MRLPQRVPVQQPANRRGPEQGGVAVQDQQVALVVLEGGGQLQHRVPGAQRLRLNDIVALVSQLGAHRVLPVADHDIEIVGGDDLARVRQDIVQDRAVAQLLQHHRRVALGRFFSAREDNGFQFEFRF